MSTRSEQRTSARNIRADARFVGRVQRARFIESRVLGPVAWNPLSVADTDRRDQMWHTGE